MPSRGEHDDGRAVLEPAHFLALAEIGVAGDDVGSAVSQVEQHIEEVQPDARDQDRRHRHQREELVRGLEPAADDRALVLAEQILDSLQRNRIHVPRVAGDIGHLLDRAVMRRVEAVVHARRGDAASRRCRSCSARRATDRREDR